MDMDTDMVMVALPVACTKSLPGSPMPLVNTVTPRSENIRPNCE